MSEESEEFQFYYKLARYLAIASLKSSNCTNVAGWMKFIKDNNKEKWALKLLIALLYCLSRKKFGPFANPPPDSPDDIDQDASPIEILNDLLDKRDFATTTTKKTEQKIFSTVSHDQRVYASYQEIDNFGVHVYLGTSDESVNRWFSPARDPPIHQSLHVVMSQPPGQKSKESDKTPMPCIPKSHEESLRLEPDPNPTFRWDQSRVLPSPSEMKDSTWNTRSDRVECLNSELERWIDRKFNKSPRTG